MKPLTFTLLLLALANMTAFGQQFLCGTNPEETQDFDYHEYANFVANYKQQAVSRSSQAMDTVRVKLFISGLENSNKHFETEILSYIDEINEQVKSANFQFYIDKENVTYILNSYFSIYNDVDKRDSLRKAYNDKDALDMYVFNRVFTREDNSVSGFSTGNLLDGGLVVLSKNVLSKALIAHELGHSLYLDHTHGQYNSNPESCINFPGLISGIPQEVYCRGAVKYDNQPDLDANEDGIPDCLQTGDRVCDTNADPRLNQADMVRDCEYIGTATDYYGDLYNPDVSNFMSYAPSSCRCSFTEGQLAKMRYYLDSYLECNCNKQSDPVVTVVSAKEEGKGTLRKAITCLNYCERLDKINFDLPEEDSVLYVGYLPPLYTTASIDGLTKFDTRITLDGQSRKSTLLMLGTSFQVQNLNIKSSIFNGLYIRASETLLVENCDFRNNGRDGLYIFNSDKVVLRNISSIENDSSGLYVSRSSNVEIHNSSLSQNGLSGVFIPRSQHVSASDLITQENGNIGLYAYESTHLQINGLNSVNNSNRGLWLFKSDSTLVTNSILSNNTNHGILLDSTNQVAFYGNNIKSNPQGLALNDVQRVTIGGLINGRQNQFTANTESSISLAGNTQEIKISQNIWACNEMGITIDSTAAKRIKPPIINPITDPFAISGTSGEGEIIALYKSSNCSPTCEGEIFIIEVVSNGQWRYILTEPLEDGDRITAISTKDNNSSGFADCVTFDCTDNAINCMATNVTDISITDLFEVFPNPVAATLSINKKSNIDAQVSLFNKLGQLLSKHTLTNHNNNISMDNHPSGMYFLLIDTVEGKFKQKIIKL